MQVPFLQLFGHCFKLELKIFFGTHTVSLLLSPLNLSRHSPQYPNFCFLLIAVQFIEGVELKILNKIKSILLYKLVGCEVGCEVGCDDGDDGCADGCIDGCEDG